MELDLKPEASLESESYLELAIPVDVRMCVELFYTLKYSWF